MQLHSDAMLTRVGLISSEPMILAGLESAFEGHPSIRTVSGEADYLLTQGGIHCLIADISDNPSSMVLQLKILRLRPDIRLIVLGPSGSDELMIRVIAGGARAFLDSNAGQPAIRRVVEAVIVGTIWAPRRVLSGAIDKLLKKTEAVTPLVAAVISPRERQVLNLIMSARSNREIAAELGIEERTVKAYVANLMRKTGAENRVSLSVQATRQSMSVDRAMPS
jgi:DNA-binding NarL/FixJ family response regulator